MYLQGHLQGHLLSVVYAEQQQYYNLYTVLIGMHTMVFIPLHHYMLVKRNTIMNLYEKAA